jgi:hypothetical protein
MATSLRLLPVAVCQVVDKQALLPVGVDARQTCQPSLRPYRGGPGEVYFSTPFPLAGDFLARTGGNVTRFV